MDPTPPFNFEDPFASVLDAVPEEACASSSQVLLKMDQTPDAKKTLSELNSPSRPAIFGRKRKRVSTSEYQDAVQSHEAIAISLGLDVDAFYAMIVLINLSRKEKYIEQMKSEMAKNERLIAQMKAKIDAVEEMTKRKNNIVLQEWEVARSPKRLKTLDMGPPPNLVLGSPLNLEP